MAIPPFLFFILIALAVAALLLWPLLRRRRQSPDRREAELALCREQLREIARDRELGLVEPAAARAAEVEIQRRMLRLAAAESEREADTRMGPLLVMLAALLVPLAGGTVYVLLGRPDLLSTQPDSGASEVAQGARAPLPAVEEMVGRLEARLEKQPDDVEGWLLLARSKMVLQRYDEAVAAYRQVKMLDPSIRGIDAALGEALTMAAQGIVTEEARAAFEAELQRSPRDPRARFYLGLAAEQEGRFADALARYLDLGRDSTSDAPWLPQLRDRIRTVAMQLGRDPGPLLAEVGREPPRGEETAAELSDAERRRIEGMVARLAARLADDPDDLEGWRMLARSYRVLGRRQELLGALRHLAERQPEDIPAQLEYAFALLESGEDGRVPREAERVFAHVLALDPGQRDALYYLGLAAAQRGEKAQARMYWQKLLGELPADSPERREVERRLRALDA